MIVEINIPDPKITEFKAGFLQAKPVPLIKDPNTPGQQIPEYTDLQWIKKCVREYLMRIYHHGKTELATQTVTFDEEVVENS